MNKEEIENKLDEIMNYLSKENISRKDNVYTNFVVYLQKAKNYIEQLENKVKEQEQLRKRPNFYYDNNRNTYVWCCRCSDSNMSLHMFLENGEIQQYASEHYDKWCENAKEVRQIDVCEFMHNFVKPLIKEKNNLKAKVKEQDREKQVVIDKLNKTINKANEVINDQEFRYIEEVVDEEWVRKKLAQELLNLIKGEKA